MEMRKPLKSECSIIIESNLVDARAGLLLVRITKHGMAGLVLVLSQYRKPPIKRSALQFSLSLQHINPQ